MTYRLTLTIALTLLLAACGSRPETPPADEENAEAKALLQGIWVNEEDENPLFRIIGDSVFFPDNMGEPQRFAVIADTLVMYGSSHVKYPVIQLSEHLFIFGNSTGETVRLVKSTDSSYMSFFRPRDSRTAMTDTQLNQQQTIKSDTVVMAGKKRYHCYLQVNPTTYKVYKSVFNDEGVEMENIYYDNTIYLSVFDGAQKLYSHEFAKADFAGHIADDRLQQTILNNITLDSVTETEISYYAQLNMPDTPTSYILRIVVTLSPTPAMTITSDK